MNFSHFKQTSDREVEQWIIKSIPDLTIYQKEYIRTNEIVRFSPYRFLKRREPVKANFFFRLTIILLPFYFVLLFLGLPIKLIITGKWGYGSKFIDNFHNKWLHKLNIN